MDIKPTYKQLEQLFERYGRSGIARVNHSTLDHSCSGHSQSMKISRNNGGGLDWKCFRCEMYGAAYPSAVASREARRLRGERSEELQDSGKAWRYTFPEGYSEPFKWSKAAKEWLLEYVSVNTAVRHGAVEAHDRLWLPVRKGWDPVRWTGRRLYDQDNVKYLTGQAPGYKVHDPVWPIGEWQYRPLVLVEDIVSAWSIAEKLQVSAYPVMGTSLTAWQANYLYVRATQMGIPRVIVWLDNDNPTVNNQARRMVNTLQGFGLSVVREAELGDPKRHLAIMAHSEYNLLLRNWRAIENVHTKE